MHFDLNYSPTASALTAEKAEELFAQRSTELTLSQVAPDGEPDIIVVCGAPRSGTTLVNNILCASSETNPLIPESVPLLVILESVTKLIADYQRRPGTFYSKPEDIYDIGRTSVQTFVNSIKEKFDCKKVVLKSPAMSPYIPLLVHLFPDRVRCIGTFRQPQDIIASMLTWAEKSRELNKKHFYERMSISDFCNYVLQYYSFIISASPQVMNSIFMTKYEILVENPQTQISRFEKITGLDLSAYDPSKNWNKGKIDFSKGGSYDLSVTPLYQKAISTSSVGSAGKIINSKDLQLIGELCSFYNDALGYDAGTKSKSKNKIQKPIAPLDWLRTLDPNSKYAEIHRYSDRLTQLAKLKRKIINQSKQLEAEKRKSLDQVAKLEAAKKRYLDQNKQLKELRVRFSDIKNELVEIKKNPLVNLGTKVNASLKKAKSKFDIDEKSRDG